MKRTELDKSIYINEIDTDRFKSNIISYYIVRPLCRQDVTKNALLPLVLKRGSQSYPTNLEIQKRLEELYGVRLGVSVLIRGDKQILNLTSQFVDERYLEDQDYLENVIDLINDIIFHPLLEDGYFKADYVKREKENLSKKIKSKINDKRSYAIEETIKLMCKGENYSIPSTGYIEDLETIDEKNLYDYYLKVLEESPIEIFYSGRRNEKIESIFRSKFKKLERGEILSFQRESISGQVDQVKEVVKKMDVNQAKLVLGYRTGIGYEDSLYNGLLLANVILGGSSNSKLFLNVREKESLAYYVGSRLYKYKSIILIDAGIEFKDYEKTKAIIAQEIQKMKDGEITDREIEIAKKAIISDLNGVRDSIMSITEIEFSKLITGDRRSLEEKIQAIEKVSYEEIVRASQAINLDTIYFIDREGETSEVI